MRRDLIALPDNSRVWIYQSNRKMTEDEQDKIRHHLVHFSNEWSSHGQEVDCYTQVFHHYFLVFVADENKLISGCSIDSSVHLIQNLGAHFNLDFFDRLNFLYFNNSDIERINHTEFSRAVKEGVIKPDTLIFDNLVNTKKDFIERWVVEVQNTWFKKYLK